MLNNNVIELIQKSIIENNLHIYDLTNDEMYERVTDMQYAIFTFAVSVTDKKTNNKKLYLSSTKYCESIFTGCIFVANILCKNGYGFFEILDEILKQRNVAFDTIGNFYIR